MTANIKINSFHKKLMKLAKTKLKSNICNFLLKQLSNVDIMEIFVCQQ